jgi:hypothetical protein
METTSIVRRVRPGTKPFAGREGSTAKPFKKRAKGTHTNGFLNHAFKPFWGVPFADWKTAEQSFFQSVDNLCALHGWTVPDVSGLSFPDNIRKAYNMIVEQQVKGFGLKVWIGQDKQHDCCLATAKTYDTAYHLYYIPVRPLWKMRGIKAEQELYHMLLAVFAYFYQVAGIPFFNEPGNIAGNYETIKNWLDEEMEDDDRPFSERQKSELKELEKAGKILLPEIQKPFSLTGLETSLGKYRKDIRCDAKLTEVVHEMINLIKDYPKRAIKETMSYEAETDDNDIIFWEQYISFYWSGEDCLAETLYQLINDEFQEMCYQEEPICLQWFDTPQEKASHVFDFEPRLFSLINRLCEILNDYDNEKPDEYFLQ